MQHWEITPAIDPIGEIPPTQAFRLSHPKDGADLMYKAPTEADRNDWVKHLKVFDPKTKKDQPKIVYTVGKTDDSGSGGKTGNAGLAPSASNHTVVPPPATPSKHGWMDMLAQAAVEHNLAGQVSALLDKALHDPHKFGLNAAASSENVNGRSGANKGDKSYTKSNEDMAAYAPKSPANQNKSSPADPGKITDLPPLSKSLRDLIGSKDDLDHKLDAAGRKLEKVLSDSKLELNQKLEKTNSKLDRMISDSKVELGRTLEKTGNKLEEIGKSLSAEQQDRLGGKPFGGKKFPGGAEPQIPPIPIPSQKSAAANNLQTGPQSALSNGPISATSFGRSPEPVLSDCSSPYDERLPTPKTPAQPSKSQESAKGQTPDGTFSSKAADMAHKLAGKAPDLTELQEKAASAMSALRNKLNPSPSNEKQAAETGAPLTGQKSFGTFNTGMMGMPAGYELRPPVKSNTAVGTRSEPDEDHPTPGLSPSNAHLTPSGIFPPNGSQAFSLNCIPGPLVDGQKLSYTCLASTSNDNLALQQNQPPLLQVARGAFTETGGVAIPAPPDNQRSPLLRDEKTAKGQSATPEKALTSPPAPLVSATKPVAQAESEKAKISSEPKPMAEPIPSAGASKNQPDSGQKGPPKAAGQPTRWAPDSDQEASKTQPTSGEKSKSSEKEAKPPVESTVKPVDAPSPGAPTGSQPSPTPLQSTNNAAGSSSLLPLEASSSNALSSLTPEELLGLEERVRRFVDSIVKTAVEQSHVLTQHAVH